MAFDVSTVLNCVDPIWNQVGVVFSRVASCVVEHVRPWVSAVGRAQLSLAVGLFVLKDGVPDPSRRWGLPR